MRRIGETALQGQCGNREIEQAWLDQQFAEALDASAQAMALKRGVAVGKDPMKSPF